MADVVFAILGSVVLVSLMSLIGIVTLSLKKGLLDKILFVIVAFAAGTLLGGAVFDLIPEAVELGGALAYQWIAVGIVLFILIERFIHIHHHRHLLQHKGHKHDVKPYAYLNLIGEAIHNLLDGMIIAAAYLISLELGIIATLAVILHEIPQELGDFGILVAGGFSPRRALAFNFIVSLAAILGAGAILIAAPILPELTLIMLAIAGGGFLYISLGNLIPELHHETNTKKIILQLLFLILGILLLYFLGTAFAG